MQVQLSLDQAAALCRNCLDWPATAPVQLSIGTAWTLEVSEGDLAAVATAATAAGALVSTSEVVGAAVRFHGIES